MSAFVSNSIVVLAILVAAGYSVWRLGPRSMRDAVRLRLSKMLPSVFGSLDTSSTGSCDACGGCAPASTKPPAARKEHAVIWRKKPVR
jgi:hypothetical protein